MASLQLLIPAPKLPWTSLKYYLLMNPTTWSLEGSLALHPNSKSLLSDGGSPEQPLRSRTHMNAVVRPAIPSSSPPHPGSLLLLQGRARLSHLRGMFLNEPISNRSGRASVPSARNTPLAHPAQGCSKGNRQQGTSEGHIRPQNGLRVTTSETRPAASRPKDTCALPCQAWAPSLGSPAGFQPSPAHTRTQNAETWDRGTEIGGIPPGAVS